MNGLRRRRHFIHSRQWRVIKHRIQQRFQMRIRESIHNAAQLRKHFFRIALRTGKEIGEFDFVLFQAPQLVNREL